MEQKNTIKATEDKMLFEQIHSVIIDKKLFLNPQFSRNEYIALGAANRNKAAQLLREFAGTNLYGYINDMRLEYARELMHERPDAPIKAISADAGFSNIRTFYRLFLSKYGTTPTNYRKNR